MGVFLCVASFLTVLLLRPQSIGWGINAMLTVGYFYGITRANVPQTSSHFIFDAAVLGLYLRVFFSKNSGLDWGGVEVVRQWIVLLLSWTFLMLLLPFQHPLVQMVGFRTNAFFIPMVLIGAGMPYRELEKVVLWMAVLNLVAFAFALGEYWYGLERFYPVSAVTRIIYQSRDLAGQTYRIPATFAHAHPYGGMMTSTLPFLAGAIAVANLSMRNRYLIWFGIATAIIGVFFTAARTSFIVLVALLVVMISSRQLRGGWLAWVVLLVGIGYVVSKEERLQRFTTLQNTEAVMARVAVSANLSFFELVGEYPLGNGLGAGGSSIPYFLSELIQNQVLSENEYSRILLEVGLPGLLLWLAFFVWALRQPPLEPGHPFAFSWRLMWYGSAISISTAWMGTGLMTAIPSSAVFFLTLGLIASPPGGNDQQP